MPSQYSDAECVACDATRKLTEWVVGSRTQQGTSRDRPARSTAKYSFSYLVCLRHVLFAPRQTQTALLLALYLSRPLTALYTTFIKHIFVLGSQRASARAILARQQQHPRVKYMLSFRWDQLLFPDDTQIPSEMILLSDKLA